MKPLSAEDVVDTAEAVLRLPAHLNVNTIEIMPVQQAFGPFAIAQRRLIAGRPSGGIRPMATGVMLWQG
jgi:hypothetical protein